VCDINNDSQQEIILVSADNTLRIIKYGGDKLKEIFKKNFKNHISFLGISDLDSDSVGEIIVLENFKLKIYKYEENSLKKVETHQIDKDIKKIIIWDRQNQINPFFIFSNFEKEIFFYNTTD
jgi:hypothetical protein